MGTRWGILLFSGCIHTQEFEKAMKGSSVTTLATKNGIFFSINNFLSPENNNDKTKTLQRGKSRAGDSGKKSVSRINRM